MLVVLFDPAIAAAEDCEPWAARVVSIQGPVEVKPAGGSTWSQVRPEQHFCTGDMVRILAKGRAALVLQNGSVIRLDEKTTIRVKAKDESKAILIRLLEGAAHFFSRVPRSLDVATPFVNCAVESTEFFVRVEKEQTFFSVFRGKVKTFNGTGELLLTDGQTAVAKKDQAPAMVAVARPRDAVQWSLYYPPIGTGGGTGGTDGTGKGAEARQAVYSASELLHIGRVSEARKILAQVLKDDPTHADALALEAIIALTLNQKERARTLAEKALANNPASSAVKMAKGYVQQAFFDIDGARATMESAVAEHPQDALAWARLSELWLAGGYQKNALTAA